MHTQLLMNTRRESEWNRYTDDIEWGRSTEKIKHVSIVASLPVILGPSPSTKAHGRQKVSLIEANWRSAPVDLKPLGKEVRGGVQQRALGCLRIQLRKKGTQIA